MRSRVRAPRWLLVAAQFGPERQRHRHKSGRTGRIPAVPGRRHHACDRRGPQAPRVRQPLRPVRRPPGLGRAGHRRRRRCHGDGLGGRGRGSVLGARRWRDNSAPARTARRFRNRWSAATAASRSPMRAGSMWRAGPPGRSSRRSSTRWKARRSSRRSGQRAQTAGDTVSVGGEVAAGARVPLTVRATGCSTSGDRWRRRAPVNETFVEISADRRHRAFR